MAASDILVSGAWLWFAPEGETFPDETTIEVGDDWGGNWDWAGLTLEPLTFSTDIETFEVDVQQFTTPVLQSIVSEDVKLGTTLAEQTAALLQLLDGGNIYVTAPGAAQVGVTELRSGGRTQRTVYTCGFEVKHSLPDGTLLPLRVFFHRVTFARSGETAYDKAAAAGVPIEITVLADPTQPAGESLYVWQKVTAGVTV